MKPSRYKVNLKDNNIRRLCGFFIFFILSLGVIAALVTIPVVVTRNNALSAQEPAIPLLLVNQSSELLLGQDMMLGVGDVFSVRSLVSNVGNVLIPEVSLFSLDFPQTVCEPGLVNNVIGDMNPGDQYECVSIRMVDAADLIQGSLGPYEFFFTTIDNSTIAVNSTLDALPLDTNRRTELSIMFVQVIDLGPDDMLSANDTITITTKFINTGNETLLNVTSRFETLESLLPMAQVEYMQNYTITLMDIQTGGFEVTESASGIGITTLKEINATETFFANTTQTTVASLNVTQESSIARMFGCSSPGDTISVTFTIENSGTETLTGVSATDTAITPLLCSPMNVDNTIGTLLPGQQETCVGTYLTSTPDYVTGVLMSDFMVTATRFTSQTMFMDTTSNTIQIADGLNVWFYVRPHFSTASSTIQIVPWNGAAVTNFPASYNGADTFTIPQTRMYEIRASFAFSANVVELRINNIGTPTTILPGQTRLFQGMLNAGDLITWWDITTFNGLSFPNSNSYWCVRDI